MATIVATNAKVIGSNALTVTTLGASDTFTYNATRDPVLVLDNVTAGALTPNLDGVSGTTVAVSGIGNVSVAAGYTCPSIAAGEKAFIPLKSIEKYLQGLVTVTGGTGIKASLVEF